MKGSGAYQMLTPTGRVEAMEKRLDATLGAVKTVQPALAKFYNSLSDEQKARFNSLRSASRPAGWPTKLVISVLLANFVVIRRHLSAEALQAELY
jgi:LTXXQ motif family protein